MAEEVCREALRALTGADAKLSVTVEDFPDRIEGTLEHGDQARPLPRSEGSAVAGREAARPGASSGRCVLRRVDRVIYNSQGGTARTTLVKYVRTQTQKE